MKILLSLTLIAVSALGQDTKSPAIPDALLVERLNAVSVNLSIQLRLTQMVAAFDKARVDILQNEAKLKQDAESTRKDYDAVIAKINKTVCEPAGMAVEDKGDTIACVAKPKEVPKPEDKKPATP